MDDWFVSNSVLRKIASQYTFNNAIFFKYVKLQCQLLKRTKGIIRSFYNHLRDQDYYSASLSFLTEDTLIPHHFVWLKILTASSVSRLYKIFSSMCIFNIHEIADIFSCENSNWRREKCKSCKGNFCLPW